MISSNHNVNLSIFEGPLDLLLHLIRKNDLNIYDIPITLILDQYLEQIEVFRELDIDVAGEFILMASELSHIKSRMLLHREVEDEDEGEDPRSDLIARLVRYQQYKRASSWLMNQPILNRDIFKRPSVSRPEEIEADEENLEIEPFKLLSAFHEILKKAPKGAVHEVEIERISITECIYRIMEKLKTCDFVLFESLFDEACSRSAIVITLLALLEMAKLKMVHIYQIEHLGSIRVKKKMEITDEQKMALVEQLPHEEVEPTKEL